MSKRINNRKGKLGRSPKHNKHIRRSVIISRPRRGETMLSGPWGLENLPWMYAVMAKGVKRT